VDFEDRKEIELTRNNIMEGQLTRKDKQKKKETE